MSDVDQLFIIGYPRSGTTYLLHLLLSSGYFPVYNFTETHFYSHYYRRYGSLKKNKNFKRLCEDIVLSSWFKKSGLTQKEFIDNIQKKQYSAVLLSVMDTISKKQNKLCWVEKTPWHCKYVKEISAYFPNAKFILIVRDPRDVVLSIINREFKTGIFNGVRRIAIAWNWHIKRVVKDLNNANAKHLIIKYEDLVTNLDCSISRINEFLNMNIKTEILKKSTFGVLGRSNTSFDNGRDVRNTCTINRWRNMADEKFLSNVESSVNNQLKRWGYIKSGIKVRSIDVIYNFLISKIYSFYKNIQYLCCFRF